MKKTLVTLASLLVLAACAEKAGEVIPVFNGTIETSEAVDLGLSVKWASCNVGADAPEKAGDYFACWQVDPIADDLAAENYTYAQGTDPVTANLGGTWRMPTAAEIAELVAATKVAKVRYKGQVGYVVTAEVADAEYSLFFPCTGYKTGGKVLTETCKYWYNAGPSETGGEMFTFSSVNDTTHVCTVAKTAYPYLGLSLRGVKD